MSVSKNSTPAEGDRASPTTVQEVPSSLPTTQSPILFPNKPGEPTFQMKLDPENKLIFKSDKLNENSTAVIDVKLTNITNVRQTFKVKCTSTEIFRVRPPLGYCDVNETIKIVITAKNKAIPENGKHFFAFYHMKSEAKEIPARQIWKKESKFEGVHRVPVFFQTADEKPAVAEATPASTLQDDSKTPEATLQDGSKTPEAASSTKPVSTNEDAAPLDTK